MSVAWSWAYVEAETGKGADALDRRPKLAAALAAARSAKGSVLVSKLDRLSRDVAFVSGQISHDEHGTLVSPGDLEAQTEQALTNLAPHPARGAVSAGAVVGSAD